MKKITIALVFLFLFTNCSQFYSAEENLRHKAEVELKLGMNDPDSYEFVSFEIDNYKESLEEIKFELKKIQSPKSKFSNSKYKATYKFYKLTFRGKNKMGALILDEVSVKATNDKDLFFLELVPTKDY